MGWFTRAWQRGEPPDDHDPIEAYRSYLTDHREQLSDAEFAFAASSDRHLAVGDAKLDRLEVEAANRRIRLRVLNGDLDTGYGYLTLGFEGARLVGRDVPRLQPILEDPDTEFLVHEVELVDGEREIRFLLWPDGELAIRCRAVTSEWQGIADDT
jgi:hypothetical protein